MTLPVVVATPAENAAAEGRDGVGSAYGGLQPEHMQRYLKANLQRASTPPRCGAQLLLLKFVVAHPLAVGLELAEPQATGRLAGRVR